MTFQKQNGIRARIFTLPPSAPTKIAVVGIEHRAGELREPFRRRTDEDVIFEIASVLDAPGRLVIFRDRRRAVGDVVGVSVGVSSALNLPPHSTAITVSNCAAGNRGKLKFGQRRLDAAGGRIGDIN